MSEDFWFISAVSGFSLFTVLLWAHYFYYENRDRDWQDYIIINVLMFLVFAIWPLVIFMGSLVLIAYVLSRLIKLVFRT